MPAADLVNGDDDVLEVAYSGKTASHTRAVAAMRVVRVGNTKMRQIVVAHADREV